MAAAVFATNPKDIPAVVKRMGELLHVNNAHWDAEMGSITQMLTEKSNNTAPAILFDDIPGYAKGFRTLYGHFSTIKRVALTLGLPLIGSHLAQMSLHVTDTVMLGWYSVEALAAGVLGASSFFVIFILGSASTALISRLSFSTIGRGVSRGDRRTR